MKLVTHNELDFVRLNIEEERSLAHSVMTTLSLPWVRGEFGEFMTQVYHLKSDGRDLTADQLLMLTEYYDYYKLEYPSIVPDDTHIPFAMTRTEIVEKRGFKLHGKDSSAKVEHKLTYEEAIEGYRDQIKSIWREVWNSHDKFKKASDTHKKFWGDRGAKKAESDPLREKIALRKDFWDEVARVQKEFKCSEKDAMVWVRDYKPLPEEDYAQF